jgi:hypothetical protein
MLSPHNKSTMSLTSSIGRLGILEGTTNWTLLDDYKLQEDGTI